ncbi:hypothetical protein SYJ56_19375 [Algoriphagus sp. D3-2-R+10]|uniref:TlpA family protein disulfide reductase n=1 Tax=Algoriphagus aurantiacus TaxID=3103948 RepID=UPI002B3694AF|nr:hypothetical protein [Algoriphagus sp. D3-2-R+10]MEB2777485.1 hypothetical protein [Algoriphagus sp. D3-2-R+10]
MKKLLLICLLGYLCLPTSTSTAQVADSPGADFLHRSGLPAGKQEPDVLSLNTVVGLPAGKQEPDVLSLDTVVGLTVSLEQGDTHRGGILRSDTLPEVFDLVDHSGQGQESASSSAPLGDTVPAVIYVEILSIEPLDSIEFRVWDPYLNERGIPKPEVEFVQLSAGNLFDGSRGAKVGQWKSPALAGYSRVTVRNNRLIYLDRFLVEPGDSVRIRFDFQTAGVLFSGPSADKFRIQYELALALENARYDQSPVMFTSNPDFWGYSEEDSLLIAKAKASKSSISREMVYISPGEVGVNYLRQGFSRDIPSHPAFEIIRRYRDRLPQEFLDILKADIEGKLRYDQIADFLYLRGGKESREAYRRLFEEQILENTPQVPVGAEWSAYYGDFLYRRLLIISKLENIPLTDLLSSIPPPVRDQVDAKYIIQNFRRFTDSNRQFEDALARMETPWVHQLVSSLYNSQRIGAPLVDIPLISEDGEPYFLGAEPGKVKLIHFWLTGCEASARQYRYLLTPVIDHYQNNPQVEFVFIGNSTSEERWLEDLQSGNYADASSLNLNAQGQYHPFLVYYDIHAFPSRMVVGMDGTLANIGNIPKTPEGLIEYIESLKKGINPTL